MQSLEAKAQKALDCPCIAHLRTGPCGTRFSDAFLCFLKSTSEEKVAYSSFSLFIFLNQYSLKPTLICIIEQSHPLLKNCGLVTMTERKNNCCSYNLSEPHNILNLNSYLHLLIWCFLYLKFIPLANVLYELNNFFVSLFILLSLFHLQNSTRL